MMKQQKTYHAELTEDGSGRTLTQEIIRRFRKNRMAVAALCVVALLDRKSTRLNSSHSRASRMPSSA